MSIDTKTPTSGSDMTMVISGSKDSPLGGLMLMPGGGVHLFLSPSPDDEDTNWEEWNEAADVTNFLLYALDRSDWISEWQSREMLLMKQWAEDEAARERARLKAKFRLIHGGLGDGDV